MQPCALLPTNLLAEQDRATPPPRTVNHEESFTSREQQTKQSQVSIYKELYIFQFTKKAGTVLNIPHLQKTPT